VVVLQCAVEEKPGRTVIHHQADFFLHTDSRMVGLATKLLGQSAPKAAEQYVGQMEMFYSAVVVSRPAPREDGDATRRPPSDEVAPT
jgi:hypothetical protein